MSYSMHPGSIVHVSASQQRPNSARMSQVMGPSYAPGEFPAIIPAVGEMQADITVNDDDISLREWIAKHSDHLDEGIHQLQQELTVLVASVEVISQQVAEIHQELEAARPMIEKWQHSKIMKLASGQMPWQA